MQHDPSATVPDTRDLVGPLLVSLLSGDERGVEKALARALGRGADLAVVSRDLVGPALDEVGEMWSRGEISIAEEHLATALVYRVVTQHTAAFLPPPGAPRLVLACLAGEFHELGAAIAALVARSSGWDADLLGANVPRSEILRFLVQRRPAAVGLSIALPAHVAECSKAIAEIRRAVPGVKVLVGGLACRRDVELGRLAGADACFADAVELRTWLLESVPKGGPAPGGLPAEMPAGLKRKVRRGTRGGSGAAC